MGAAAAGLLVGSCRSAAPPPPPATVPVPTPPTVAGPKDWAALNDALDGGVVLPSSSEYAAAKAVFNARFVDSTPAAIVAVASNDDVRRAMAFAADTHIDVAVRGGGHSYVGASSASGAMIMDLRRLPGGIVVDDATGLVTVSSAALLNSVHETLDRSGRTIPTGSCPTVGVSGLTLGGGLGPEARSLGLTCDALESAVVVLPSGDVVTTAADDHADLFWTLRGGGAAVGVVTSFTFRSSPAASRDVVSLTFPQDSAAQAIQAWHTWISAADRALWSMVNLSMGAPSGRFTIVLATPEGDGPRRATNLAAAIGVAPLSSRNRTLNPMAFVDYFAGGPAAVNPRAFVAGSDIIGEMTSDAADSIVGATTARPQSVGSATAVIESLSGAVNDVGPGESAFPWRRSAACIQWYVETPTQERLTAATAWLADAHEAVGANSVGGYVNYVEASTPAARYFGTNLTRLQTIRQRYDPDAVMYSSFG